MQTIDQIHYTNFDIILDETNVIQTNSIKYNIRALKFNNGNLQIQFGNDVKCKCIDIIYEYNTPTLLYIQGVFWQQNCRLDQAMQDNETPNLIRILLKWTLQRFYEECSNVEKIEFTDNSAFNYDPNNGPKYLFGNYNPPKIPLAPYSMLINGETWYETHFAAIPNEKVIHDINKIKTILKTPINKDFKELVGKEFFKETPRLDCIESLYDKSLSWNQFTNLIHHIDSESNNKINIQDKNNRFQDKNNIYQDNTNIFKDETNRGCNIVGSNIHNIYAIHHTSTYDIMKYPWYISRATVDNWNVDYNIQIGGQNITRKRKKILHKTLKLRKIKVRGIIQTWSFFKKQPELLSIDNHLNLLHHTYY